MGLLFVLAIYGAINSIRSIAQFLQLRMMMNSFFQQCMFLLLLISCPRFVQAQSVIRYDVRMFGAKGDGQTLDTEAINKAIEATNIRTS